MLVLTGSAKNIRFGLERWADSILCPTSVICILTALISLSPWKWFPHIIEISNSDAINVMYTIINNMRFSFVSWTCWIIRLIIVKTERFLYMNICTVGLESAQWFMSVFIECYAKAERQKGIQHFMIVVYFLKYK